MLKRWLLVLAVALAAAPAARAQEEVYVRGNAKPLKGSITQEDAKGVKLGTKDLIPADEIVDVVYEVKPISVNIAYRNGVKFEKDSLDPAKDKDRKANLAEALKKYEEAQPKIDATDKTGVSAKRHLDYKIAMLRVRQVREDGDEPAKAMARLGEFAKKNRKSWQIISVLDTLAKLQLEEKKYAEAEETYQSLADLADIPDEAKIDARLMVVRVKMYDPKKAPEALKAVRALQTELAANKDLPKNSPLLSRAKAAEAECLATGGELDKAVKIVREVIKDSSDKEVKALGHNTLGFCYYTQGDKKAARWEFLWVDVVYNQDRNEHAKALYYLWKIFSEDGDAVRAQDCREALLAPQFTGMQYQRRLQEEAKKSE